jgi:hypothetical protein
MDSPIHCARFVLEGCQEKDRDVMKGFHMVNEKSFSNIRNKQTLKNT